MPSMIATKRQRYDGKNISKDDIFNVKDKDIRLLKALGRVTDLAVVKAMSTINNPELVPNPTRVGIGSASVQHRTQSLGVEHESVETNIAADQSNETSILESISTDEVEQNPEFSKMLRERATSLGVRVVGRWSDSRVQREIDELNAKTYQRMDMHAEE